MIPDAQFGPKIATWPLWPDPASGSREEKVRVTAAPNASASVASRLTGEQVDGAWTGPAGGRVVGLAVDGDRGGVGAIGVGAVREQRPHAVREQDVMLGRPLMLTPLTE